jgi:hypothetical protein
MKKLAAIILCSFLAVISSRAQVLFQDSFNYPDGPIEGEGGWFVYETYSSTTNNDAFVTNDLLILNQTNNDSVANNFTNTAAPSLVYASFTINVSSLPTVKGGFFCVLMDSNNPVNTSTDEVCRIFIDTTNTVVPGTYRLGIANFATSITAFGATNFPLDLATGVTYQVVINWDEVSSQGGTLWVNPSSANDQYVYGNDQTNQPLETLQVSRIGFSQYTGQGVSAIGNVMVGLNFSDVMTNTPQLPVIGIQPQGTTNTIYSGSPFTLYTAVSGIDVTYQWYSNNVSMVNDGVTVVGAQSNILNLTNLQNTASYTVVATDSAGSVTSAPPAVISINSTPTAPFFTLQPQNQTNSDLSPVTLTAQANGTGPITYQWYFQAAGTTGFSALSGQTSSTLSFTGGYPNSGSYYVTAANGVNSINSATIYVLIVPPPLISLATLKSYVQDSDTVININGGQIFNVEGIVTSVGDLYSGGSASEFFIYDGTSGCLVYRGGIYASNTPPVGALVQIISPAQSYYGGIEMDPGTGAATNGVYIFSTNNPLPATVPLNFQLQATNDSAAQGTYGFGIQGSLISMTNVYLYSSAVGAAVTGNFPTNSSKTLYVFQNPYSAGQPYITAVVYTYTNIVNVSNTNYWGKPIPSFCYELTGESVVYAPTTARIWPTRYADFVTTRPSTFSAGVAMTNGTSTVSWPTVIGSTYSLYSSTNLLGPWTQTFGLSYYPSIGNYTDTNSVSAKFYRVSTP